MVSTTRKTTTKWQFCLPTVLASQIHPDFIKIFSPLTGIVTFQMSPGRILRFCSLSCVSCSQMLDGVVCFCRQHVLPASFGPLCGSVSTKPLSMALGSCLFIAGSETLLKRLPSPFLLALTFSSLSCVCRYLH